MPTRTDALVSQQEAGKIAVSIERGRLSPGARSNATGFTVLSPDAGTASVSPGWARTGGGTKLKNRARRRDLDLLGPARIQAGAARFRMDAGGPENAGIELSGNRRVFRELLPQ
jgi:hypothetical protein